MPYVGLVLMQLQASFAQECSDHGTGLLDGRLALGQHDAVVRVPPDPVAFPEAASQSIQSNICEEWSAGLDYQSRASPCPPSPGRRRLGLSLPSPGQPTPATTPRTTTAASSRQ